MPPSAKWSPGVVGGAGAGGRLNTSSVVIVGLPTASRVTPRAAERLASELLVSTCCTFRAASLCSPDSPDGRMMEASTATLPPATLTMTPIAAVKRLSRLSRKAMASKEAKSPAARNVTRTSVR